jgi:hypothetical protein
VEQYEPSSTPWAPAMTVSVTGYVSTFVIYTNIAVGEKELVHTDEMKEVLTDLRSDVRIGNYSFSQSYRL